MKPRIGDIVVIEQEEYTISQIQMKAKDGSLKITLQQVMPEPMEAETEHGQKLPL